MKAGHRGSFPNRNKPFATEGSKPLESSVPVARQNWHPNRDICPTANLGPLMEMAPGQFC